MKKFRGYVTSREYHGERAPQKIQNLVIRDYCNQVQAQYLLSVTEHVMVDCYMILEQLVNTIDEYDGIVLYSVFQLPSEKKYRECIYENVLGKSREIHFAKESLYIKTKGDIGNVEDLLILSNYITYIKQDKNGTFRVTK